MTGPPDPAVDETLELTAALAALASFQGVTQQADGKANMLLAVHVGVGVVVVTQIEVLTAGISGWRVLVAVGYVLAFVAGGEAIARAMWPRAGLYPAGNVFALPRLELGRWVREERRPGGSCVAEAWEVARVVALIAGHKNRHVVRAIVWVAVTVLITIVWFTMSVGGI